MLSSNTNEFHIPVPGPACHNEGDELLELSNFKCFDGRVIKYSHLSKSCQAPMNLSVFIPNNKSTGASSNGYAALIFLAGMTCSDDSFLQQGGALERASDLGLMLICPDSSPRNTGIPGEDDAFNLGSGASFYVDATQPKWSKHYNMYTYITEELMQLATEKLGVDPTRISISGHSMGGNGAMFMTLRNPTRFKSCSAFAPVCNPSENRWGIHVFSEYLGQKTATWDNYDTVKLLKRSNGQFPVPVLVDQGTRDFFSMNKDDDALTSARLIDAVNRSTASTGEGQRLPPFSFNFREGYDHFFFFIQTFVKSHIDFHAKHLGLSI